MTKVIKQNPMTTLVMTTAMGLLYLLWFYNIDGVYMNPPITFKHDPLNIKTEKEVYKVGETIRIHVNFCKMRAGLGETRWSIIDGKIIDLPSNGLRELPVGCYPKDQATTTLVDVVKIPLDYSLLGHKVHLEGVHKVHLEGVGTVYLSGGREIRYTYKTTDFEIR